MFGGTKFIKHVNNGILHSREANKKPSSKFSPKLKNVGFFSSQSWMAAYQASGPKGLDEPNISQYLLSMSIKTPFVEISISNRDLEWVGFTM